MFKKWVEVGKDMKNIGGKFETTMTMTHVPFVDRRYAGSLSADVRFFDRSYTDSVIKVK